MFDWNDQELENVIWGEAGEGDDHIVPYPGGSEQKPVFFGVNIKKERNQDSANVKPAEKQKPVANSDLHSCRLKRNSQDDTRGLSTSGSRMDSWTDLSLSNAAKTDQDSMVTEVSKYDSSGDELAQLDNGSDILHNQAEDREESDFVDYSWANIGSFDDLDKIFSNDDPMFGHSTPLGNDEEPWSSSKDATSSPEKSTNLSMDSPCSRLGAVRSATEIFEHNVECMLDQDKPFTASYENVNAFSSHASQNVHDGMEDVRYTGSKSKLLVKDQRGVGMIGTIMTPAFNSQLDTGTFVAPNDFEEKVNRQRKSSKCSQKSEEKSDARHMQDLYGTWSPPGNQVPKFDGQYGTQMGLPSPSLLLGQQKQLQGPKSLQYKHISNSILSPPVYGTMGNYYSSIAGLPQFRSGEGTHQQVPSGYEVPHCNTNILNKSAEVPLKPLTMTPQEKIEKLRRRQQMRAMLAIKKQQQQLAQKSSHDNQMQLLEAGNIEVDESMSSLPSLDPHSPIEQDDSNTVGIAFDNCSMEETILSRLQDIISKLDIQIRLCIQDSLLRLAQSAMQRQYASDTSSTSKGSRDVEVLAKEEINSYNRFSRVPDMETVTNPIDRTVAHLLFHRPLESTGKLLETPELLCEKKPTDLMSFPMRYWPESSTSDQTLSHNGSEFPCSYAQGDQSKTSNASNTEAMEV